MEEKIPLPDQVAFDAFTQQHVAWTSMFDDSGQHALSRNYYFTSSEVASRFAAEAIYRKHKARVNGSMTMEHLCINVLFINPDDDDSGGSVIALAQSCDEFYDQCLYPDA
ncbi:MAG: hypothetical protein HY566_02840 [Candidatus Kerfeldbacteria bacterium]|nr:hypothetical protein [Candidatus Kerfeldbacteria bacterium]